MRIAISGASSTGKTTLAKALSESSLAQELGIVFLASREREILNELGHYSMDLMTDAEQSAFQLKFYEWKYLNELNEEIYITDCSFVDVAAYWKIRDRGIDQDSLIYSCKEMASRYDIHFFLPTGLINFDTDGYRSVNNSFHVDINNQIISFLQNWGINYYKLDTNNLLERISTSLEIIKNHV